METDRRANIKIYINLDPLSSGCWQLDGKRTLFRKANQSVRLEGDRNPILESEGDTSIHCPAATAL